MSKLDNLIEKLCPDGVKFEELKEICMVSIGEFVHKNKQREDAKYPVFNGGISNTGFYDEYNNEGNKILISARGANAGFINKIESRYWAGNSCYSIDIKDKGSINWLYVYYYLKNNEKSLLGQQQTGSIPAISKKQIESFKIPVPPLEVQCEIVHVLDDFTLLSAELSAELKARKRQYEYYRNNLLTFNGNVPRKSISELCYLSAGGDIDKRKVYKEINNEYNIPVISNGVGKNAIYGYTNKYKVEAPALTISGRGTIGYCELRKESFYPIVRLICIKPKKKSVNISFLKYYIETIKFKVPTTGIPQLTVPMISNYKIPVPPVEEQEKIVNILNRFEKLCNDISEGLPAEIEARQKQYEYYRDKLLTFKELKVNE